MNLEVNASLTPPLFDGCIALDDHLRIVAWNSVVESLTGLTAAQALGRSVWSLFPDWDTPEIANAIDRAFEGAVTTLPRHRLGASPHPIYVESRITPSDDAAGVWIFLHDVTEPRVAAAPVVSPEKKPKRPPPENARLHQMLELIPAAIGLVDPIDQTYLYANPGLRQLTAETDLLGRNVRDAHAALFSSVFFTTLDRVCRTGKPKSAAEVRLHWRGTRGDEHDVFYDFFFQPIAECGEIDAILVSGVDVTDQVRARGRAEESRRQLRRFVDSNIIGVVFFDRAGAVMDANGAFLDILGYDRADLEAGIVQWRVLTPPESRYVDDRAWEQLLSVGTMTPVEKEFYRKDGTRVRVMIGGALFEGSRDRGVGFVLDLTERERSEAALKESAEKLRDAVRARDEFLSLASHELRTPVTSMKLGTQILKRQISNGNHAVLTPDRMIKLIDQYDRQLGRLTALIEDMLDISLIQTEQLTLRRESVDLNELVQDAIERALPILEDAGCEPRFTVAPRAVGNWDRRRLEQVLTNLLTNAARFGRGKPIDLVLTDEADDVVLTVIDRGIGVAAENHERIFQRFERAVSADEISGLGLGLYIVRRIVEAHGGTIELQSGLGQGARFIARFPRDGASSQ